MTIAAKPDPNLIREIYMDFKQLRTYAISAKDYFYEASDLEKEKNLDIVLLKGLPIDLLTYYLL